MKSLVSVLLIIIIVSGRVVAQTKVNAADIIAQVNRGEAVTYKNAEITGNLDLTQLANKKLKKFADEDNERSTKEYISTVTAPLTFSNCTFTGKVLAYYNPDQGVMYFNNNDKKNEIYNTHFDKAVRFENCTFEQEATFKYSQFKDGVSFAGSQFKDEAFFKYSKFEQA
ncbi:MAG: pentapeptide repeat-containing protein, partial [Bacteroidota bacterium]|nr:pentapeptide repeat-containing protein [Bacteroidota bacterium]